MKIRNATKKTILSTDAIEAKSLKAKSLGLITAKEPQTLLFKTRFGIHTFGMKFPIDVIVLDRNYKILALRKNLKPNNIFVWNPKYDVVIELPEETIEKTKTERGDRIEISI